MNLASPAFDFCAQIEGKDGTRRAYIRNADTNVLSVNFAFPTALPDGTSDLFTFLDEFDKDPQIAEQLPVARTEVGKALESVEGISIRTLRLRKGFSQIDLARAIGTSQAAVSAIENRVRKPGEVNIRDLARALDVDFNTLMEALANA